MPVDRIEAELIKAASKRRFARSVTEFEKWDAVYTALKTQWNKKTGNRLIEIKEAL